MCNNSLFYLFIFWSSGIFLSSIGISKWNIRRSNLSPEPLPPNYQIIQKKKKKNEEVIILCGWSLFIYLWDNYSKPTWGLARFHFTYPWFKTLHFAHLNFNPLAFRNPSLRLPSEIHIFRQKQT